MAKSNHAKNSRTETGNGRKQTFSLAAPTARSVQLVGDFTHWQQRPVNLQKGSAGIWQSTIELEPGTHHYRFLVDGEWRDDPECIARVPNPFGGQDCVCHVG